MDKEYLSLMAELGEAPVPTSGGHSMAQGGPSRASGANSTQPLVSCPKHSPFFPPCCQGDDVDRRLNPFVVRSITGPLG